MEPLLQFLLLGAGLFIASGLMSKPGSSGASRTVRPLTGDPVLEYHKVTP
jgi:hypothetical protein